MAGVKAALDGLVEELGFEPGEVQTIRYFARHKRVEVITRSGVHKVPVEEAKAPAKKATAKKAAKKAASHGVKKGED